MSQTITYDFKSPKISTFELADGRSFYAAFTLNKKQFGTVRQCKLMHQLLYSILYQIGKGEREKNFISFFSDYFFFFRILFFF